MSDSGLRRVLRRGLGRSEPTEQFDPHELGARRSDPELGAFEPLPTGPISRFSRGNLLFLVILLFVVVALFHTVQDTSFAAPPASCTTPAYTLNKTEVKMFGVISWRAVGPAGTRLVFGVDSSTPPQSVEQGLVASPTAMSGCSAAGRFGVSAPSGDHTLTVFAVLPDGSTTTVGTTKIEVD